MSHQDNLATSEKWQPQVNPWIIAAAVMLPTFMEVLDTAIANVALPYIAGDLAASLDDSTWVLTSYLVSNAIVLPSTAYLSGYFGRKRFLMVCIVVFLTASALCGLAMNLEWMIVARIFQGLGGGGLQPISQAILLESFPKEKRGTAMAAFAMGVVIAPALGPILGGWITYNYIWRWIFYINIPIGILSLFLIKFFVEDPPYLLKSKGRFDYWGLIFLSLWIGTLQPMLDKGQQDDWFGAPWIRVFSVISTCSFILFIVWEWRAKNPLVNLKIFKNRNFAVGILLMGLFGACLYALITLSPLFFQDLMGYTAYLAGLAVSPRGVGAMLASVIIGRITGLIDGRFLMAIGFGALAWSSFALGNATLTTGIWDFALALFIGGVGTVCVFIPLATTSVSTLRREEIGNATGIFNLMRNLAGGIGISVTITFLERGAQQHQNYLVRNLLEQNPIFLEKILEAQKFFNTKFEAAQAAKMALGVQFQELIQQATLFSYMDDFRMMGWVALLGIPVIMLFQIPKLQSTKKETPSPDQQERGLG